MRDLPSRSAATTTVGLAGPRKEVNMRRTISWTRLAVALYALAALATLLYTIGAPSWAG